MSAIATTTYASSISALLLANSSDASATSSDASTAAVPSDPTAQSAAAADPGSSSDDRGPATNVQLSDKVKAILAQATSDATVAQRLQSFVDSQRSNGEPDGSSSSSTSTINVDEAFQQLSGSTADETDIQQPVQVVKSFATGLKADGYTISAMASDNDGSSRIIIFGTNGFNFLDEQFGSQDEATTGQAVPGQSYSEVQSGNVEYITINQQSAAATGVQASSSAGTTSATSTASQSSSVTIAVDFNTGQVSLTQAEAASLSTTAQISQQTPSFSTMA